MPADAWERRRVGKIPMQAEKTGAGRAWIFPTRRHAFRRVGKIPARGGERGRKPCGNLPTRWITGSSGAWANRLKKSGRGAISREAICPPTAAVCAMLR
jgi:hypothetical protein